MSGVSPGLRSGQGRTFLALMAGVMLTAATSASLSANEKAKRPTTAPAGKKQPSPASPPARPNFRGANIRRGPQTDSRVSAKMRDIERQLQWEVSLSRPIPATTQPSEWRDRPRRPRDLTRITRIIVEHMRRLLEAGRESDSKRRTPPPNR